MDILRALPVVLAVGVHRTQATEAVAAGIVKTTDMGPRSEASACWRASSRAAGRAAPDWRVQVYMKTKHCDGRGFAAALAAFAVTTLLLAVLALPAFAQADPAATVQQPVVSARKIFTMLFLMLGPIKILMPFVNMTRGTDVAFRRRLATRAVLFSAAALAVAGLLGRGMLENFNISVPVLALTGGLVLFLVALQTVLQQAAGPPRPKPDEPPPALHLAFSPLAFPTIVTPYGIAAVIVFAALAQDDYEAKSVVAGVVLLILALDWLAMLFAETILRWVGTTLQVFAVVLGVTQIALGLQVIMHSLSMIGVFVERAN